MPKEGMRVSRPEAPGARRLVVLAGDRDSGETCRTFVFHQENHTLGNALCSMLLTNPQVLMAMVMVVHGGDDGDSRWR